MAVVFALVSLVFAGVSDVVFKRYSSVARSRGVYVMGVGAIWTVLQLAIALASGDPIRLDPQTVVFGVAAGLLVSIANLLLIESLSHADVGLASTVYRLNTIAVVVLAVGLLGERLTAVKATGVLLGIAAIVVLYERLPPRSPRGEVHPYFCLAIAAALLRAGFGIVCKAAVLRGVDLRNLLLVNAPVWTVVGAAWALLREPGFRFTRAKVLYSAISALLICAIANFLMLALERGDASIVVPIANMSFVVALMISVGIGMERYTGRKVIALALAIAAIVLLSHAAATAG